MSWSLQRKFFLRRKFCPEEIFLTFVFYIKVYQIHFQNIHTFIYQKSLLHTLFCLFLKSSKTFSVSLRRLNKEQIFISSPHIIQFSIYFHCHKKSFYKSQKSNLWKAKEKIGVQILQ